MKPHMATNDGAVARLSGRFPPGTKVGLYRGQVDNVPPDPGLGGAFKTATVNDLGEVEFRGLDDDERLFIAGVVEDDVPRPGEKVPQRNWRSVAIHASVPVPERKPDSDEKIAAALASTVSAHELEPDRTTVGARGSRSLSSRGQPFASSQAGKPTPDGAPAERVPHLRQEDARDVEQRSATFTGQATPVDPDEEVPKPRQDGPVDLEQRSATGVGELTPIPAGEQTPGVPQSPDGVDLEQRSATPHGSVEPVPTGDPVGIQRRKESSAAKAEGSVQPPVPVSPPRKRSQKRNTPTAKKKRPARTEAQKAARRKRDAQRKGSK